MNQFSNSSLFTLLPTTHPYCLKCTQYIICCRPLSPLPFLPQFLLNQKPKHLMILLMRSYETLAPFIFKENSHPKAASNMYQPQLPPMEFTNCTNVKLKLMPMHLHTRDTYTDTPITIWTDKDRDMAVKLLYFLNNHQFTIWVTC